MTMEPDRVSDRRCCATPRPAILSKRERECLLWSARGKSSWSIGIILHISTDTVNFHIKNALKKLGTSSRIAAAIKATKLGLIDPS